MKQVWAPVAVALLILAPSAALASGTVVRSVRLVPREGVVTIIVEADGPLPLPKVGVLEGPPRVYLDFRDVTTATTGTLVEGNALVREVRVALNRPQPPVTRVVIELARAAPHRIEAGGRDHGEVTVVIGAPAATQPVPPSPQIATPQTPAQVTPPQLRREPAAPPVAPSPAARPASTPAVPPAPGALTRAPRPGASGTVVRSVRLAPGEEAAAIVVEADGPLPTPTVGVLKGPPRIYLDFRDVTTAKVGTLVQGNALVRRVRVGLNQPRPPVTRVVIELARAAPHRIEAGGRQQELRVVVGASAATQPAPPPVPQGPAPAVPAAQAVSPAPAPAGVATPPPLGAASRGVAARAPAKDVERYLQQTSSALDRLERLRPVLGSLDVLKPVSEARLKAAAGEFESTRQALAAIEPPRTLTVAHDLFGKVCVLGALSTTTRLEAVATGDTAKEWNAASAAASAMLLLDLARAELGLAPIGSPERR